jgi:hypothetical protein
MIDIDFSTPIGQVRAKIGDPTIDIITDNSITSALTASNDDIDKASLLLMRMIVRAFATMADREREGQVEIYYTKLYERYKLELKELERSVGSKYGIPVYIGGTSLEDRNANLNDTDLFNVYDIDAWNDLMLTELQKKLEVLY